MNRLSEANPQVKLRHIIAIAVFAALLAPSAIVALYGFDCPHFGRYLDDGIYFATAKSIAGGHGYRIASLPDQPFETKYPPAYPLLLSAVWRLDPSFPRNTSWALVLTWLAVPLYLFLLKRLLARLEFSSPEQWLLAIVCIGFATLPEVAVCLLSDLWFSCAVLGTLLVAELDRDSGPDWLLGSAAGLLAASAYLTRTAGIAAIASVPLVFLLQRKWTRAGTFCSVVAPVVIAWTAWASLHAKPIQDYNDAFYTSYTGHLSHVPWSHFPALVSNQTLRVLVHLGSGVMPDFLQYVLGFTAGSTFDWLRRLVALVSIAGAVSLTRNTRTAHYLAFSGFYTAELLIWPWSDLDRLFIPLVPLVAAGFLHVLRSLLAKWARLERRTILVAGVVPCLIFAWVYVLQCVRAARIVDLHRASNVQFSVAYKWISLNIPVSATFVAFRDANLYLHTGRRAEGYHTAPWEPGSRRTWLADFARARGHRYILLGPGDFAFQDRPWMTEFIIRGLDRDPNVRSIYREGGIDIYEVRQ